MSLRVWLPLNGSLENQGLDNITVTNNGNVTIDDNGKIGKCYSFNGSNYLSIPYSNLSNLSTTECSMCVWAKLPEPTSGNKQLIHIGKGSGWVNNRFVIIYRTNSAEILTSISDGTNYVAYNCSTSVETNTWIHIATVYKNKTLKLYINGDLKKSYTTTYDISFNSISSFGIGAAPNGAEKLTGYLNDARIYDHALSAQEVKQIAQGLILHYPLNRNGWGNENLALGTDVPHTTTANKPYTLSDYNLNGKTVTLSCRIDADNITLTGSNQRIGLSLKCTSGSTNYYIEVWKSYRATQISSNGRVAYFGGLSNNSSFHGYISHTFTCPADAVSFGAYTQDLSSGTVKISHVKLEIGNKRTAWCPNSMETLASNYNINTGNVPLGYQELEYIESAGAAWLSTEYIFNPETDSCKVIFKGNDVSHNGMIFGNDPYPYFWIYYYGSNGIRLYARNESNGQQLVTGIASDTNQHTVEYKNKHFYVDGVDKGSLSNTYGACSNPIYLFNYRDNSTYPFKGRIYYVDIKTGSTLKKKFIPVRRTVDSAIGMLEIVSGIFYPSMTSTAFTAGTAINIPTSITYDISGFKNNGVSIGAIGQDGDSPKYGSSAVFNGVDTCIKNPNFIFTSNIWSISLWYYYDTAPTAWETLVCLAKGNGADANKKMALQTNTGKTWIKSESGSGTYSSLNIQEWTHLVLTCDGVNGKLYENGVLKLTSSAISSIFTDCVNFGVGAKNSVEGMATVNTFLKGKLSDVRVYATTLSATDVKELYEYNPIS